MCWCPLLLPPSQQLQQWYGQQQQKQQRYRPSWTGGSCGGGKGRYDMVQTAGMTVTGDSNSSISKWQPPWRSVVSGSRRTQRRRCYVHSTTAAVATVAVTRR